MSDERLREAALLSRLEGLAVEARTAGDAFVSAAATTLRDMEDGIVRNHPMFYSPARQEAAGVVDWDADAQRLWPDRHAEWLAYQDARRRMPSTDLRAVA